MEESNRCIMIENINPAKINISKNKQVIEYISNLIKQKKMSFDVFMTYFEKYVESDWEFALIITYYANNALKKNMNISSNYRLQLINAMLSDLNIRYEIDYKKFF